jgi:hypothetical protein
VLTILLLSTILALAVILISAYVLTRRNRRPGIASAATLQRKYGLYAENRPVIRLDPQEIPSNLRPLMSLAEKWGIGDDIIRNDYIDKASDAEKGLRHPRGEGERRLTCYHIGSMVQDGDQQA